MKYLQNNFTTIALSLLAILILFGWPIGKETSMFIRLLIFAVLITFAIKLKKNSFIVDENKFSQQNVTVLFEKGEIIIKGDSYDVKQINRISIGNERMLYKIPIIIQLDNFKTYEILIEGKGEHIKFLDRLKLALRKAGRPDLDL